jgi:hypothetical protein
LRPKITNGEYLPFIKEIVWCLMDQNLEFFLIKEELNTAFVKKRHPSQLGMSEMQSKTVVKDRNAKLPVSKAGERGREPGETKGKVVRAQKTTAGTPAPLPYCSTATCPRPDLPSRRSRLSPAPALDRAAIPF